MHSTQPRMASLDSWDRTRSQTWRSAVPRWAKPVERLLLRNCATEPASLLLRSLITRDRSKMKTAGMLPDCGAQKKKRKKESWKKEGEGWLREGMKSPPLHSLSFSLCQERQSTEGAVKPGCQNFPSEPQQKICPDKRRGVMESEGETSVRPLQSQLILHEVISSAETHSHTHPHWVYLTSSLKCRGTESAPRCSALFQHKNYKTVKAFEEIDLQKKYYPG